MRKKADIVYIVRNDSKKLKLDLEESNAELERMFKSLLCEEVKDNDLLITLEESGLSYQKLEKFIYQMIIPPKVKRKTRIERLKNVHRIIDRIIGRAALPPKASELKKYDPPRFNSLLGTIEQLNSLSQSEFINTDLKSALIAESERISDEYGIMGFFRAIRKYLDQVDEKITTERYSIGKTIGSIYEYIKQLRQNVTQDKAFGLIADILNSRRDGVYAELREAVNNNKKFTSKRIRDLYTNYVQKKS